MELLRNGLKLVAVQGLDDSEGSVNVPVKLVHNSDDQYVNFTEQLHIRYINDGKAFEEILPSKDSEFYIPGKVFVESGPIQLAVHLINGDVERVTNELQFVVKKAPNGKTLVDPSEFSWQQLVDQYVSAKLETFADKADMNEFKNGINANLTNQDKKITDLQTSTKFDLDSQSTKINDITSTQNSKIAILESRMSTFTSLKEGSTTGDAELIDARIGADGTKYPSAGDAMRGQIEQLKEDIGDILKDKNIGENLYNKSKNTNGKYINSNGTVTESETLFFTELISIIPHQNYCFSMVSGLGGYFCISQYDENKKFIKNDNIKSEAFTIDVNTKRKYIIKQYDCAYIVVSSVIAYYANNLMIAKGNNLSYEDYLWYWNDDTRKKMLEIKDFIENRMGVDFKKYELPYIKDGKLCCNGSGKTAYYTGVDCGSKITAMWCNFVFEEQKENLGNATLIINPNGVDSISDITNISLHCQIFPDRVKMDVLGGKFGEDKYYYQTLLNFNFDTTLVCDGVTEHTAILSVVESSNNVYLTIDGTQYSAHFTPDSNITSISDVIGQYITIEHFCTTERAKTTMPMFTYLQARDVNKIYKLRDYFDRQNGVLQNAPTGQPYHLINNERYKR